MILGYFPSLWNIASYYKAVNKGNKAITELRAIVQRESQNL
jgi:hypothetical protein